MTSIQLEVEMRGLAAVLLASLGAVSAADAADPTMGRRVEIMHESKGHEAHLSFPAVAVGSDGVPIVAWGAPDGERNSVYVVRAGLSAPKPVRVNPDELSVDALHQPPGIAVGPGGEIYVSWSSRKPKPEGGLFASDLQLSRSLDGGQTFARPLPINEDRPLSHSFEGLAVAPDGTVVVAWVDSREGGDKPRTYLARVLERGTKLDGEVKLDGEETCVCCRVAVAAGPGGQVAVLWRKVFPGSVRDMVVSRAGGGARSLAPPALVHADRWRITACPHRGGSVATDGSGRVYVAWYTEGRDDTPRLSLATSSDGRRFTPPTRLDRSAGSVPDHVRLAVDASGRAVVVWQDSTAVRRRVLMRYSLDGGRTLSPVQTLSSAIKAYGPDVAVGPTGQFVVAWHEEQFPAVKTIVQPLTIGGARFSQDRAARRRLRGQFPRAGHQSARRLHPHSTDPDARESGPHPSRGRPLRVIASSHDQERRVRPEPHEVITSGHF